MDIHCICGHHSHIDAEFAYYVVCPNCERTYFVNGHVELVLVSEAETEENGVVAIVRGE